MPVKKIPPGLFSILNDCDSGFGLILAPSINWIPSSDLRIAGTVEVIDAGFCGKAPATW